MVNNNIIPENAPMIYTPNHIIFSDAAIIFVIKITRFKISSIIVNIFSNGMENLTPNILNKSHINKIKKTISIVNISIKVLIALSELLYFIIVKTIPTITPIINIINIVFQ